MAQRALSMIDPHATRFTFQLFHDREKKPRPGKVMQNPAKIFHDTLENLWPTLVAYNRRGHGIFVTVNETDGTGRKARNITRPRAVFQELDRPKDGCVPIEQMGLYWNMLNMAPIRPSIEVESSPGNRHNYYCCDGLTNQEWEAVQLRMVADHMSDENAKDISRVLRVPGFFHCKNEPFMVRIISGDGRRYSREEIIEAFPPVYVEKTASPSIEGNMAFSPATEALVRSWTAVITPPGEHEYQAWFNHGLKLARLGDDWIDDERGDIRLELWETLSRRAAGFEDDPGCTKKWEEVCRGATKPSDSKATVTFRSLQFEAERAGWAWENSGIDPGLIDDAKISLKEARGEPERLTTEEMFGAADAREKTKAQTKRFELIPFDSIKINTAPAYRIKGILPDYGLCVVWGPPKCGKSFLVFDMVMHVALGRDIAGGRSGRAPLFIVLWKAARPLRTALKPSAKQRCKTRPARLSPFTSWRAP